MVVYGRLARQLVPFLCIATALLLERVRSPAPRGRALVGIVWTLAVCQALLNFHRPLTQVFPAEFRRMAADVEAASGPGEYVVLVADFIYPLPLAVSKAGGTVLLERPHPLEFLPFQYEGWTPDERYAIRVSDIRMRLVRRSGH